MFFSLPFFSSLFTVTKKLERQIKSVGRRFFIAENCAKTVPNLCRNCATTVPRMCLNCASKSAYAPKSCIHQRTNFVRKHHLTLVYASSVRKARGRSSWCGLAFYLSHSFLGCFVGGWVRYKIDQC